MVSTKKIVDTILSKSKARTIAGVRVNRTGRRTYTLEYKLDVVRQCAQPGASVAGVALANGINANLVRRWMVRHQRELVDKSAVREAALLPVVVEAIRPAVISTATKLPRANSPVIEIELHGARIRVRGSVDGESLRTALAVLGER